MKCASLLSKARIYFPDGWIEQFDNQALAYAVWLALPEETHAAFRGINNGLPVYPWDYVDNLSASRMRCEGNREKRLK